MPKLTDLQISLCKEEEVDDLLTFMPNLITLNNLTVDRSVSTFSGHMAPRSIQSSSSSLGPKSCNPFLQTIKSCNTPELVSF